MGFWTPRKTESGKTPSKKGEKDKISHVSPHLSHSARMCEGKQY
jgi:hypothetical protein